MKVLYALLNSCVAIAGLYMLKRGIIDQCAACVAIATASYMLGLLAAD